MKICFVLDDTIDSSDGVQQYVLSLGGWLESHGHEVHYIVGKSSRTDIKNVHTFSGNLKVRFNKNALSIPLPASPKKIHRLLYKENFDVLHVQMPYSPMLAERVISLAPPTTAIVGTFHIAPYSKLEKVASQLLGTLLKPHLHVFDEVMSVSKPAHDLAKKAFHLDSKIVPNMVDLSFYKPTTSKKPHNIPHIVFLGRLVERKGCYHFIQALKRLSQQNLPFAATIIGGGKDFDSLLREVHKSGLDACTTFLGHVTEEKKKEMLHGADVAVFPSTGGESFGIVLLEAMAAGAGVVIAGNNVGYSSVLGEIDDVLVDPKDHAKLAELIAHYCLDKTAAASIHARQQLLVSKYDTEVVAKEVERIYISAVEKNRRKKHN